MSLEVNSISKIDGRNGAFDNKEPDESIRYGRNAVNNNMQYLTKPIMEMDTDTAPILDFSTDAAAIDNNIDEMEKFADKNDAYLNSLPPLEYEYRYVPEFTNGNIDKKAVLGAAYQEMGKKEMPVKEFEYKFIPNENYTAEPIDINKDGNIDVAEYGANIVATDVLSKDTEDVEKADGTINQKGLNSIMEYTKKANAQAAATLYQNVYDKYKLGEALEQFNPQE